MRDSGLVVNESKTEVCLFHKNDQRKIKIKVFGTEIASKNFINVLGITFDSKMNWSIQVANAISKAKKSLYALRQIRPYFSNKQMRTLLDSYFYSTLYYNASVWLTPDLSSALKHDLLTASALALRSCLMSNEYNISFINVHKINNKCTPNQIMLYQISLSLYIHETECTLCGWLVLFQYSSVTGVLYQESYELRTIVP